MIAQHSLELGDRVQVMGTHFEGCRALAGAVGTVVIINHGNGMTVGVQFDNQFREGHDCAGHGPNFPIFKTGHCRWGPFNQLKFLEHGEPITPISYDLIRQSKYRRKPF